MVGCFVDSCEDVNWIEVAQDIVLLGTFFFHGSCEDVYWIEIAQDIVLLGAVLMTVVRMWTELK